MRLDYVHKAVLTLLTVYLDNTPGCTCAAFELETLMKDAGISLVSHCFGV